VVSNLIWVDLEMTGLDVEKDQILEIATLVTDSELKILAEGPNLAIYQSQATLDAMDEWNQTHHGKSGLIKRVQESTETLQTAQEKTLTFLKDFCQPKKSPLCGNSVWQDRRFIGKYMPLFDQFCHYRIVDVSSIKELVLRWYPTLAPIKKVESHEALADIRESVIELEYYRQHCFIPRSV